MAFEDKTRKELMEEMERLRARLAELEEKDCVASGGPDQREALLENVLKVLPVGVWITDRNGKIVHANPAGQRIWAGVKYVGMDGYGEYKGWWADTGEPVAQWAVERAIQKGETSLNEEIEIECFDKTHKVILNSAVPLQGRDGEIIGAIIVNQDITERKHAEDQMRSLIDELQDALRQVKLLSGLLPICSSCKKVRDDKGYWNQIENYIRDHSEADFTHSICPDCARELYPEFYREDEGQEKGK